MNLFSLNSEISIGNFLTILSITLSVIALLISWNKDQTLRRKEYADRIRQSASTVAAKIERWKYLSLKFFDDLQPFIVEADIALVNQKSAVSIRDLLWQNLVILRSKAFERIMEEEIELAYTNLYGYDTRIQKLFTDVIARLRSVENYAYQKTLYQTQLDVFSITSSDEEVQSSELGNKIRDTCYKIRVEQDEMMTEIIVPFTNQLINLIQESDSNIFKKRLKTVTDKNLYSMNAAEFKSLLDEKITKELQAISEKMYQALLIRAPRKMTPSMLQQILSSSSDTTIQDKVKDLFEQKKLTFQRISSPDPVLIYQDEIHRLSAGRINRHAKNTVTPTPRNKKKK